MRAILIILATLGLLFFNVGHARACTQIAANRVDCDLEAGTNIVVVPAGAYAEFTNNSGENLQIDKVTATTEERIHLSEFCLTLDLSYTGQPGDPGVGEVACTTKNAKEDYPPITWDANTGLAVSPGSVVSVGSNTVGGPIRHTYTLAVAPQTSGLYSWRQPRTDEINKCTNAYQWTSWKPWVNTGSTTKYLAGASIYAVSAQTNPNKITSACLYITRTDGTIKFTFCPGVNKRGTISFTAQPIEPGESVIGLAVNKCPVGRQWDWVSYLWEQDSSSRRSILARK